MMASTLTKILSLTSEKPKRSKQQKTFASAETDPVPFIRQCSSCLAIVILPTDYSMDAFFQVE